MFRIPRGTRDFTPEEMEKRRYVERQMRTTFQVFGYREIQTPMFETLELFTAKSGDTILEEIYSFTDKSGRKLALRPELTAPVIRFYVDKMQMSPKPLKLFYFGSCFRYDRPQRGRYREFRQAGCELIGTNTPEAYAELIALAYFLLKNIGLKNIRLNIGDLDVLSSMLRTLGIPKDKQKQLTPLIDKSQFKDLTSMLHTMGIKKKKIDEFVDILQTTDTQKILEFLNKNTSSKAKIEELEKILDLLRNSFDIKNYHVNMSIVRGLDYYKGLVFEIDAPVLGAEKQLCGGGAYELIPLFGGKNIPTAGFAIGFDRTILALEAEKFVFPKPKTDIFIVPINNDMMDISIKIAQNLRKEGIPTDIDLLRRDVRKSLKYANAINAEKTILVGPKDVEKNCVTLRDMRTGEQQIIKIKDIPSKIKTKKLQ
ncbi:MAG: histidine--tRNA ligase [Thermoplasmata archaeon]|nr:MAG: histidine--tRNA ligase [Thermoplasmata archaeon]